MSDSVFINMFTPYGIESAQTSLPNQGNQQTWTAVTKLQGLTG